MRPQTVFVQPTWRVMKENSGKRNPGREIMEQVFWEAFGKHLGSIWETSEKHMGAYGKILGRQWGDAAGRSRGEKLSHENLIFHSKNQHVFHIFEGSVSLAWRFEGRSHQVPILTIEKAGRQRGENEIQAKAF